MANQAYRIQRHELRIIFRLFYKNDLQNINLTDLVYKFVGEM